MNLVHLILFFAIGSLAHGLADAAGSPAEGRSPRETSRPEHNDRLLAGKVFEIGLFWDNGMFVADTLLNNKVCAREQIDSCNESSFHANCASIHKSGKIIYRVKNLSSISAAILHDLGYHVFYLSQLQATTPEGMNITAPGMSQNYHYQTAFSDYLWEEISGVKIDKKPKTTNSEFDVRLYYDDAGYCLYGGKDDIVSERAQIMGTSEGIVLKLMGNSGWADLSIRRRVVAVYLVSDKTKKATAIVNSVEKEMDKLNLDVSYKAPELIEERFSGAE